MLRAGRRSSRRVDVSEFPASDKWLTDDLGGGAEEFDLTIYVIGEDALDRRAALERCIPPGAVVLAEKAPRVAWLTDATAVYLPASDEDLWTIVEGEPISFVQITRWQDTDRQRFDATFTPRPDCAPDLYARRGGTDVQ